jgi:hypothetical protein
MPGQVQSGNGVVNSASDPGSGGVPGGLVENIPAGAAVYGEGVSGPQATPAGSVVSPMLPITPSIGGVDPQQPDGIPTSGETAGQENARGGRR